MEQYDTVMEGFPIWYVEYRIVDTFLDSYDFSGKTLILFATSGGSGIGSSAETLHEQSGNGNWLGGERFSSGASNTDLQALIEELQQAA